MLIARTYQPEYQHEGIRIADAAEWLSRPNPQKELICSFGEWGRFDGNDASTTTYR